MTKIKLKKKFKYGIVILILLTILSVGGFKYYQNYLYEQTYEYKFLQLNYKLEEIKILVDNLKEPELNEILLKEYNELYVKFASEKYFMYKNINRYIDYISIKDNKNTSYSDVVAIVNVERDKPFYEGSTLTDTSKGMLMLVNKYHNLTEEYAPENINKINLSFAYANNSISEDVINAFKELHYDAKENGYTIVINSSYRTYKDQDDIWQSRKASQGIKKADQFVARAGHSEHQTGFAIDVADFHDINDKFEDTEAFNWMKQNCYKYGFILRYPEGKEYITGYEYEAWHYRYIGKEMAEKVFNDQITYDEYYAFYLAK